MVKTGRPVKRRRGRPNPQTDYNPKLSKTIKRKEYFRYRHWQDGGKTIIPSVCDMDVTVTGGLGDGREAARKVGRPSLHPEGAMSPDGDQEAWGHSYWFPYVMAIKKI